MRLTGRLSAFPAPHEHPISGAPPSDMWPPDSVESGPPGSLSALRPRP